MLGVAGSATAGFFYPSLTSGTIPISMQTSSVSGTEEDVGFVGSDGRTFGSCRQIRQPNVFTEAWGELRMGPHALRLVERRL